MRYFAVLPARGTSNKWPGFAGLFFLSLALISSPQSPAFAQQASAQQQIQPEITLVPVELVSPIERAQKSGTALSLTLKDVTKLALQNNLDIAIADTNEETDRQSLIAAYAYYAPTLSASVSSSESNSANTQINNQSASSNINTTKIIQWSLNFNKPMNFYGSQISGQLRTTRRVSTQLNDLFALSYAPTGSITYTQPLLRGFKVDANRNKLKTVNLDAKITDSQFKNTLTNTVASIQKSYWNLVSVIQSYDVTRKSVELARITVDNNRKKVEVGTSPPIDVTSSLATQASRELDLISAEERILSAQNALRQLISNDKNNEIWSKAIVPTDKPDYIDYSIDLNQAIETALKNRPELEQSRLNLEKNDISYSELKEALKWKVDLSATLGTNGTAGPQNYDSTGKPRVASQFVGGLLTGYKTMFTEGTYNWVISASIDIPLSRETAQTNLAKSRITRQQYLMNRNKTEQSIVVNIRDSVQALNTAKSRLKTAEVSRKLAEAQLDAENKRFEAGLSQNYLVLQRQNELSSAQLSEVNAMITYRTAIITLQQAMFTLLDSSDINVAKGSSQNVPITN